MVLSSEAVRVGQMIYHLKQCGSILYEFKTDSCLYKPLKRKPSDIHQIKYSDTCKLRDRYDLPGQRRLDSYCTQTPITSEETVYRSHPASERDLLQMDPKCPRRQGGSPNDPPTSWQDLTLEDAEQRVQDGQSLLLLGCAGTGKSTWMMGQIERLQAQGKKVHIISKTHCASSRIGGCTADHFVRRHILFGSCHADVLWIDEISQLDCCILAQINKLTYTNI